LLREIPSIGPIRAALLVALLQTPRRFRTKRQLWAYIGSAPRTYTRGEYHFEGGQLKHSKNVLAIRGLNRNHNHDLKNIFKRLPGRPATADHSGISTISQVGCSHTLTFDLCRRILEL